MGRLESENSDVRDTPRPPMNGDRKGLGDGGGP